MSQEFVCKDCGHIGVPSGSSAGSGFFSALIFLLFMIPLKLFRRKGRCNNCGSSSLASLNSKYGKAAMEEFYMNQLSSEINKKKQK